MNNPSKTVLWIGLALIALNLVMQWPQIKSVLFTGEQPAQGGGSSWWNIFNSGGVFNNPINPIPIPLSTMKQQTKSRINVGNQFPKIGP